MQAFLMLADAAQADHVSGKLNMLGADWAVTGPQVPPFALAVFLRTSWEEADRVRPFTIRLLDSDGEPVLTNAGDGGMQPVVYEGQLALSDAPSPEEDAIAQKIDVHSSIAISMAGIGDLLQPGRCYVWSLEVEDKELATVSFAVRHSSEPMI